MPSAKVDVCIAAAAALLLVVALARHLWLLVVAMILAGLSATIRLWVRRRRPDRYG
jgi:hypothetical protein